jgi:hypothetical protein
MAFFKGSFYERVPLFAPDERGRVSFKGVCARPLASPEPVLEHSVSLKERLDSVAQHYYADTRSWRRIADTNPDMLFPEDILYSPDPIAENGRERLGDVVLIPRKRDGA